jgi:hypothetical protein
MKCKALKKAASLHIDARLHPVKARQVEDHLIGCAECSNFVRDLRLISRGLGQLPMPAVPPRLLGETLEAFDWATNRRRRGFADLLRQLMKIAFSHPQAVSSVASLVITASLFTAILAHFKPIPEMEFVYHRKPITFSTVQFNLLNQGAQVPGAGVYTLPRVQESNGLDAFLDVTKSRQLVLITEVQTDGRASVVDVLGSPTTAIVDTFRSSFQGLRFHPATSSGRPVATQLVLLVQKLDVE